VSSSKGECTSDFDVQRVNPLADPNWDSVVATCPGAGFFHGTSWLQVLHATYGFTPEFFISSQPGKTPVMLPMMEVNSWLTGRRGVGLPFTDECAPLCADAAVFASLYKYAVSFARERGWKYLECRGGRSLLGDIPASTAFFGHSLDLRTDEAQLFARTDAPVRRAVRKAEQSNLTVTVSQDFASLRTFYALMCLTRKRHGLPAQPFGFFANIHRHILSREQGRIVLAWLGSVPVAGAVFFHFGRSAIYKFGASDERLQHLRANNLVMWEAIKWHAQRGFDSLDFGRTSLANAGLRKFKLSWGTVERTIEYMRWDLRTNAFVTVKDEAAGWYNRIFRFLPVSVSRLAGALLYKHAA
jgi:hypothetical protein